MLKAESRITARLLQAIMFTRINYLKKLIYDNCWSSIHFLVSVLNFFNHFVKFFIQERLERAIMWFDPTHNSPKTGVRAVKMMVQPFVRLVRLWFASADELVETLLVRLT